MVFACFEAFGATARFKASPSEQRSERQGCGFFACGINLQHVTGDTQLAESSGQEFHKNDSVAAFLAE